MRDSKLHLPWQGIPKMLDMQDNQLKRLYEGVQKMLDMQDNQLKRLYEGVQTFNGLKEMELNRSIYLKEIPDLSKASNLEKLQESIYLTSIKYLDYYFPRITKETLWTKAEPNSFTELYILFIPSLVELPSFIKNLIQPEKLKIRYGENLETLPTDINFFSLRYLHLHGCSRLRSFPNISTNIKELDLSFTGIEEVPWWIENFTKLKTIYMSCCSNLVRVSLNIYKLKLLEWAYFGHCEALSEASWNDHPIAIDEVLSGVEVPLHFIHQTTGYSMTNIPLLPTSLSQQLFKFRACVVVVFVSKYVDDSDLEDMEDSDFEEFDLEVIDVRCEFKDRIGNSFLWVSKNEVFIPYASNKSVVFVLDYLDECNAQLNYNHVDMEIHIRHRWLKLKRWGVQLLDECSSPMKGLSNPHVCEDNFVSESEDTEDSEDNKECIEKRQRETGSEDNSVSEREHNEECIQTVGKRRREAESMDLWETPRMKRQDTSTLK